MNQPIINIQKLALSSICSFTLLSLATPAFADDGLTLEEVIVTATKRAVSLQDVPISVIAMSGEKLDDDSEILQVDTYPLTIYSAAAIQELNEKVDQSIKRLAEENALLKNQNSELMRRLELLENRLK